MRPPRHFAIARGIQRCRVGWGWRRIWVGLFHPMDPTDSPPPPNSLVFWFGDLNFRIESYDLHFVKFAIDNNQLHQLWEKDQVQNPSLHPQHP